MKNVNRDYACDIIRIIATFIVIATHVKLGFWEEDSINDGRLILACLFSDGVSVFFILSGFFLFNGRKFSNIVKKMFLSICVPALLVALLTQIIYPWVCSAALWGEQITFRVSWRECAIAILQQNAGAMDGCFHFWYIFTYVKWILFYPLLKWICQEGKEQTYCRWMIIILQMIAVCVSNIKLLINIPLNVYSFIDTSVLLGLIGYEINYRKDLIKEKSMIKWISLATFIAINYIRFIAQKNLYIADSNNGSYISWDSIFGIIGATTLFVHIYSWNFNRFNEKIKNIIKYISDKTFMIYLFHVIVYFKFNSMGIQNNYMRMCTDNKTVVGDVLYSFGYPLLIFMVTLLCVMFLLKVRNVVIDRYNVVRKRFEKV